MRKVFERIAKSLENIVELLKTQAQERAELKEKIRHIRENVNGLTQQSIWN
ncbi:TPA: hypothetical protein U2D46_002257 [Streptococcus suis]|nr:hypothetical protein [Streptococcus suis]HEM6473080.1 hypothetical protein [Streptococcus suis]